MTAKPQASAKKPAPSSTARTVTQPRDSVTAKDSQPPRPKAVPPRTVPPVSDPGTPASAASKPRAPKASGTQAGPRKPAARKPAARKPIAPKPAAQKPSVQKPTAQKPAVLSPPAARPEFPKPVSARPAGRAVSIAATPIIQTITAKPLTKPSAPVKKSPPVAAPPQEGRLVSASSVKKVNPAGVSAAPVRFSRKDTLHRLIPAFVLVPVLAAAGVLLVLHGQTIGAQTPIAQDATAGAAPAAAAEAWLVENTTNDQRLLVDPAMASELAGAGMSLAVVVVPGQLDAWRDADYVVVDDALRAAATAGDAQVGQAITNSVPTASFGEGDQMVEIRRIAPEGAVLGTAAVAEASAERAEYGSEVAQNEAVVVSAADTELLTAGRVDDRIAFLLGSLAARGEVVVSGFPSLDGEQGRVIRQVAITSLEGNALVSGGVLTADGDAVVGGLSGSFVPADVFADGSNLVLRYSVAIDPLND